MDCYMINTKVYVCMKETVDDGKIVEHIFSHKDKAWVWVRNSFVKFTEERPDILKETFNWTNEGNEHSCWCDYLSYGWYVYEMKIEN
jgi:hypothetical protein